MEKDGEVLGGEGWWSARWRRWGRRWKCVLLDKNHLLDKSAMLELHLSMQHL